jgi:hypothetical protein
LRESRLIHLLDRRIGLDDLGGGSLASLH